MNTPPFFAVQKQTVNGETTLVAAAYTLDQKDIDPTANLTLYVDTLTIPAQTFTLKGKNITIYSRKVISAQGAVLDTSAEDDSTFVLPYNPPKADNGAGVGQSGKPGADGGNKPETIGKEGKTAGNITIKAGSITGKIHSKAVGGKGQQGQKGQDGGDGINGGNGNDAKIDRVQHDRRHPDGYIITPATPGSNGGNAGNGGKAGKSGNGGKGGTISVVLVTANPAAFSHENIGGAPGNAAAPGQRGRRGTAGLGGRIAIKTTTQDHFHRVIWELSNDREPGARDGDAGSDGGAASPAAQGDSGGYTVAGNVDPSSMLVQNTGMLSLLTLSMRFAEIEYVSGNLANAIDYYKWIGGLTSAVTGATGLPAEFAGVHRQSRAMLNQLSQGLDFYANPMSFVPIVTLDYLQNALEGMLATGATIESVFNTYTIFLADQTKGFTKMGDAIARAKEVIKTYQAIQANVKAQIESLPPVINQLGEALVAQYEVLMRVNEAFKKAVEAQKGCTLASLLALVKTIASVGKDVFDAWKSPSIKSLTTALTDLKDLGISIENGKIVQNPLAIQGNPQDVADAWKTINPSGSGDVADDKKLIVLRDEFDKTIKPYLSLPEAKEYQKQLHDYIGIAQARNAKLLEYTNAAIQFAGVLGIIDQKKEEVKRIEAQIATENVPGLITYRNFLFNLYEDFKSFVLRYLYQENRAYIYWSQGTNAFVVEDNSFTGLAVLHSRLKGKIIDQINIYSNPDQPITDLKIVLKANGREKQFADFKTSRKITFNISTSEDFFLGWANVMLTNFRIYLKGAGLDENGKLYVQLVHHGSVFVIDPDDKLHDYTHNQVLSVFQYRIDDGKPVTVAGGSLGGDGTGSNPKRIALSPYATFTIGVPEKYNKGSKLDNLESIEIHFAGYAKPPKKLSRRALK